MAYLWTPFSSLTADNLLASGASGYVFTTTEHVVIKVPIIIRNACPEQVALSESRIESIEREKKVYNVLMKNPNPNIVRSLRLEPEGIFMERLFDNLQLRINRHDSDPIEIAAENKWILQIAEADAWLEHLGLVHGDLRPANILLDRRGNVKLSDFDTTVPYGHELQASPIGFCRRSKDGTPGIASPVSEQFAFGSCLYTIRTKHTPFDGLDPVTIVQHFTNCEFPTLDTVDFGPLIDGCWHGRYKSIVEVKSHLEKQLAADGRKGKVQDADSIDFPDLLKECDNFLVMAKRKRKHSCSKEAMRLGSIDFSTILNYFSRPSIGWFSLSLVLGSAILVLPLVRWKVARYKQ
ncbi:kinase-like protein [Xylona heveae TC161]|uniref:EKC/KEOPS complex subunit BUD32 n=1 Tax=Xylona heveae (strain CBS 132557 / TC161) TaxID=1328760 RepID=A0A165IMF5_XYLHT|nr:kinase-like protein [Xylona heveae TC161]KZF25106.1 kinase-like protein [Xylona heveae TC161]